MEAQRTHPSIGRWYILFLISLMYLITYLDRVNISTVAPVISKDFGFNKVTMGIIFSAFVWALPQDISVGQAPLAARFFYDFTEPARDRTEKSVPCVNDLVRRVLSTLRGWIASKRRTASRSFSIVSTGVFFGFMAESVKLDVSREKDGKFALRWVDYLSGDGAV